MTALTKSVFCFILIYFVSTNTDQDIYQKDIFNPKKTKWITFVKADNPQQQKSSERLHLLTLVHRTDDLDSSCCKFYSYLLVDFLGHTPPPHTHTHIEKPFQANLQILTCILKQWINSLHIDWLSLYCIHPFWLVLRLKNNATSVKKQINT